MLTETESTERGEGENYFVSMTDMMVGMLFIFIIMLMTFALLFQQKTDEQQDKIVIAKEIARRLDELQNQIDQRIRQIDDEAALRQEMLEKIKEELHKEHIAVQISDLGTVLRFNEQAILFATNSSELDSEAQRKVSIIANVLAKVLPNYVACQPTRAVADCKLNGRASLETVFIEGHTDSRPGTVVDNWTLSASRASATYFAFAEAQPSLAQLKNSAGDDVLAISGYSSTRPVDPRNIEAAWQLNRRIDLRFVMESDNRADLAEVKKLLTDMGEQVHHLQGDER